MSLKPKDMWEARYGIDDYVYGTEPNDFLGENRWDLVVSVFAHTPPPIRARVHAGICSALRPTGCFILEAYTPGQIGRGTGGPPVPELTMTLDGLRRELIDMTITSGRETIRPVVEGPGHTGDGAVVQVIAKPEL